MTIPQAVLIASLGYITGACIEWIRNEEKGEGAGVIALHFTITVILLGTVAYFVRQGWAK